MGILIDMLGRRAVKSRFGQQGNVKSSSPIGIVDCFTECQNEDIGGHLSCVSKCMREKVQSRMQDMTGNVMKRW